MRTWLAALLVGSLAAGAALADPPSDFFDEDDVEAAMMNYIFDPYHTGHRIVAAFRVHQALGRPIAIGAFVDWVSAKTDRATRMRLVQTGRFPERFRMGDSMSERARCYLFQLEPDAVLRHWLSEKDPHVTLCVDDEKRNPRPTDAAVDAVGLDPDTAASYKRHVAGPTIPAISIVFHKHALEPAD
ncbi:MAG: hypothetical protein HY078_17015 [Elusimicrobia bacterium]|nr:hypothetical protein [Elusimicrobiota bacterium]